MAAAKKQVKKLKGKVRDLAVKNKKQEQVVGGNTNTGNLADGNVANTGNIAHKVKSRNIG